MVEKEFREKAAGCSSDLDRVNLLKCKPSPTGLGFQCKIEDSKTGKVLKDMGNIGTEGIAIMPWQISKSKDWHAVISSNEIFIPLKRPTDISDEEQSWKFGAFDIGLTAEETLE